MSRLERTPPTTPKANLTQSEPELHALETCEVSFVNVNRNKRMRTDLSPKEISKLEELKSDIKDMLASWKIEQEEHLMQMIEKQNASMSKLVADLSELKIQNSKIQQSADFISNQYEDLRKEIISLQKERQEQKAYIENLEKKVQDLQFKSRSSCIEVRNVPQKEKEVNEDLTRTVSNIGKAVGMPVQSNELRDVYRLPGKPGTTRPIVVEFSTVSAKQNMLSAVRDFNKNAKNKEDKLNTDLAGIPGQRQPVYVADFLPSSSKKLFFLTREFAKKNGYKFCWSTNSNIFLRKEQGEKQILVHSEKCLADLQGNAI